MVEIIRRRPKYQQPFKEKAVFVKLAARSRDRYFVPLRQENCLDEAKVWKERWSSIDSMWIIFTDLRETHLWIWHREN